MTSDASMNKKVLENYQKLMTACVILRIEDFTLYRVTTSGKKQMPKEFISGNTHFICINFEIIFISKKQKNDKPNFSTMKTRFYYVFHF